MEFFPHHKYYLKGSCGSSLKTFVPHNLQCVGQEIMFASKFEIVHIDAKGDLQREVAIETFPRKDALGSKFQQRL